MINQVIYAKVSKKYPILTSFYQKSISKGFCTLSGNTKVKTFCSKLTESKEANLKSHPDEHYCGALFRYLHELAIKYQNHSAFISIDDKHHVKTGEPGYPVAAVEH